MGAFSGLTAATFRGNSRVVSCTESGIMCGRTVGGMRAPTGLIRNMVRAPIHTRMEAAIAANGKMVCSMVSAASLMQRAPMKGKGFGPLANSSNGSNLSKLDSSLQTH